MNEKFTNYLNGIFAPYDGLKSVAELKADLLSDLQERFRELKAEGKNDETAFEITIDSIGDIEQTVKEVANLSRSLERQVLINFSASNLGKSDFAGVTTHKGKFEGSALLGSDFSGADLTGSSFKSSDVREANFDGANLTDCNFSTLDLASASFHQSILVRTSFSKSGLAGAKFIDIKLTDVNLTMTDLRKTVFENCTFNGAGKTTIVKILTTLLKQDSGTAAVNGFDVASRPDSVRQSISLTGQFAAVDEILTGRENLIMIAKLRHLENPRQMADDLLERFSLIDAAECKVSTYSGGMRRRLDIAMSLIGKPQLIFLDEPTTGLDPEARIEVWKIVKALADSGTTIFLTTQYLDEAEQLADRIAILHEGRIIVSGTLAELKKLFPPAKVEYVEKQPTLEEIFLAIIGKKEEK